MEFDLDLNQDREKEVVGAGHNWNGIVGLEGKKQLNDRWYMDYYADIGTGNANLTWQAKLGGGYQFNKWTATFGLRYLRWNFKEDESLDKLRVIGPWVGARWVF